MNTATTILSTILMSSVLFANPQQVVNIKEVNGQICHSESFSNWSGPHPSTKDYGSLNFEILDSSNSLLSYGFQIEGDLNLHLNQSQVSLSNSKQSIVLGEATITPSRLSADCVDFNISGAATRARLTEVSKEKSTAYIPCTIRGGVFPKLGLCPKSAIAAPDCRRLFVEALDAEKTKRTALTNEERIELDSLLRSSAAKEWPLDFGKPEILRILEVLEKITPTTFAERVKPLSIYSVDLWTKIPIDPQITNQQFLRVMFWLLAAEGKFATYPKAGDYVFYYEGGPANPLLSLYDKPR